MPPTGLVHYALAAHSSSTLPKSSMTSSLGVGLPVQPHWDPLWWPGEAALPGTWPDIGPRQTVFTPGARTGYEAVALLSFLALSKGPHAPLPAYLQGPTH